MDQMIGRKIESRWYGIVGTIERWEPLGAGECDVMVRHDDGSVCWYASHGLKPTDGLGPLPDRREAQEKARLETVYSLRTIRAQHVASLKPWPGAEFGKVIIGAAIDGAIKSLTSEEE